jgi:hypothetical protein
MAILELLPQPPAGCIGHDEHPLRIVVLGLKTKKSRQRARDLGQIILPKKELEQNGLNSK